jgi:hypothetical protein
LTGGTLVLTASQAVVPYLELQGTLTSNLIVQFPALQVGQTWWVDTIHSFTFGGFSVSFEINGNTMTSTMTSGALWQLTYTSAGTFRAINLSMT